MLRKLVYLNFLLVFNQSRVLGFQPVTINDHFLVDSTFKTGFIDDWLRCLQICDAEPRCVSYNFRKASGASGLCELNFCGLGDLLDSGKSLMYSPSFVFQQIREGKVSRLALQLILGFPRHLILNVEYKLENVSELNTF